MSTSEVVDKFYIKYQDTFPTQLNNGLTIVDIRCNNFNSIPDSFFDNNTSITELTIRNNTMLHTLPLSLRKLSQLTNLVVVENINLTSINQDSLYSSITNLKNFCLYNSATMKINTDLLCSYLTNLSVLCIGSNRLTTISDAISTSLNKLTRLALNDCHNLTSLKPIFQCTQLMCLQLATRNSAQLVGLQLLKASYNISSISKLVNLTSLQTYNIQIGTTTIHPSILSLTSLEILTMHRAEISIIPEEMCTRLTNLRKLSLHGNPITCIPYALRYLVKLENLGLYKNPSFNLSSTIYTEINPLQFAIPYSIYIRTSNHHQLPELKICGLKGCQWICHYVVEKKKSLGVLPTLKDIYFRFPTLKELCARFIHEYSIRKNFLIYSSSSLFFSSSGT